MEKGDKCRVWPIRTERVSNAVSAGKRIVSIVLIVLLIAAGASIIATGRANASPASSRPAIGELHVGWIGYEGNFEVYMSTAINSTSSNPIQIRGVYAELHIQHERRSE
ncbi:MAG: hypothetical protein KHF84_05820 [Thermoplasmata archaeon]|nr:hypothetical protein [Candidatus Sysuiplasma jiujiangense]MBX8639720.1 hypothetical protein [Candidatus Sysuiplasma jiujiangense]